MSELQTVSEALDFFLDYGPAEDKHIEHLQVVAEEEKMTKMIKNR